MRTSPQKGILAVIFTVFAVLFVVALVAQKTTTREDFPADSVAATKMQLLALASSSTRLTPEARKMFFESLSGPKVLQYNFTAEEKMQIIKILNRS